MSNDEPIMAQQAKQGDTVRVHYTGTLTDGTVFDSSAQRDPLEFTIGAGQVIPGFEQAVVGMAPEESRKTAIAPEEAYGERHEDRVVKIDRGQIPPDIDPEPGMMLQMQTPEGQPMPVVVRDVDEASVTLDANHPLAGQELEFELELVEIK